MKIVFVLAIILLCFCLGSCSKNEREDKDVIKLLKSQYNKEFEIVYIEEMKSGHPFADNFFRGEAKEIGSDKSFSFTLDRHGKLIDSYYSVFSTVDYPDYKVAYKEKENIYSSAEEYLSDYNVEIWMSLDTTYDDLLEAYTKVEDVCKNPYYVSACINVDGHAIVLAQDKNHSLKTFEEVLEECKQ